MAGNPKAGRTTAKPTIAIVGAGSLATFLAVALDAAGFTITEIIARDSPQSRRKARKLAVKVGAQAVTANSAALDATLLWFCVPDREIRRAASALAARLAVCDSPVETGLGPSPPRAESNPCRAGPPRRVR